MIIHRPVHRPGVGRRKAADLVIKHLAGGIASLSAEGSLPAGLLAAGLEIGLLLRRECAGGEHLADGAALVVLEIGPLRAGQALDVSDSSAAIRFARGVTLTGAGRVPVTVRNSAVWACGADKSPDIAGTCQQATRVGNY